MPKSSVMLVHESRAPAFDAAALRDKDGEPRVRDLDLAQRLGFADPHKVRALITRNDTELRTHGEISATPAENTDPNGRGRPGKEYWLNEGQAFVVCALSRTRQAARVRKALIDVFMAYRRGRGGPPSQAAAALDRLAAQVAELRGQIGGGLAVDPQALAANPLTFMTAMGACAPAIPAWPEASPRVSIDRADVVDLLQGADAIGAYLGFSARRVYYLKEIDGLPHFRIGGRLCATRAALRAWIAARAAGKAVRS